MSPSPNMQLSQLDYDAIKDSLIQFLQSQSEFSDYDFTGSALSVLINLLAYNTHYLAYYLNMIVKEMFLDSANLRESVVSLAKQLNYTPKSRTAASAILTIIVNPVNVIGAAPSIVLDKNTKFTTTIDGVNYSFLTTQAYTAYLTNGLYTFNNVIVREGSQFSFSYTYDVNIPDQRFIIPSPNVDTTTLTVTVQNSNTDAITTVFNQADFVTDLDGTSLVYFLQEVEDAQFQVYFGNNIIGKGLRDGNIVTLNYFVCNADTPNKTKVFTSTQAISGLNDITVITATAAFGGAEREPIENIKFAAPKAFQSQNRAVTDSDFRALILRNYPNINSVSVWGGQLNVPPQWGKVFISVQPVPGYNLTSADKDNIIGNILNSRKVLTITPEFVDPDLTYLEITSLVKYSAVLTNLTAGAIQTLVIQEINDFCNVELNKFNNTFKYSNLATKIDSVDPSVSSNLTNIRLQKRFVPILNSTNSYTINFYSPNPILPGTLSSNSFVVKRDPTFNYIAGDLYQFDDDMNGNIRMFKGIGDSKTIVKPKAGTINYTTGLLTINNFIPDSINLVSYIKLSCSPVYNDVMPSMNNIILLDPSAVTVTMNVV
jgi:baseplate wedge protein gp6